jgi:hypothetical protein
MKIKIKILITKILTFALLIFVVPVVAESSGRILVNVNKATGEYIINSISLGWEFKGSVGRKLTNLKTENGSDAIGQFREVEFSWNNGTSYEGRIKWYVNEPVVLFYLTLPSGLPGCPNPFPSFTSFPNELHKFSYHNIDFAPAQFTINETSTPWLFFNNNLNSFILSPASDFIVSKLTGDGSTIINSGLNEEIKNLPKNFTHSTILVLSKGIGKTWQLWGRVLRTIYKRKIPRNDFDRVLKYFGYWTDNGADYYYNYDTTLGYERTLLELGKRYKKEGIPLGYMQLDSWWYEKSIYDPDQKPVADHKNPNLPYGEWNRYGGLLSYTPDHFLFKNGLAAFQKKLNLPLVTHNRWIDPSSPYHKEYKISGYAAIDPKFWEHIISYIKSSGVICYEQDWLNILYDKSPEMATDLSVGNAFTDGMANACNKEGLTMQYCMPEPRFFLQGLKYNNLTTIRPSFDRFEPIKWKDFLYGTQLAYECGMYPWCDVFKSSETGNLILANLSAGPVGTGDAIGKEDKANILKTCRKDGVLVKPDLPILPVDEDYINDASNKKLPMLAYTYTRHQNIKTGYIFAFSIDSSGSKEIDFNPSKLGIEGDVVVYNPLTKGIKVVQNGSSFNGNLKDAFYTYYIIAPVLSHGLAFLGDSNLITATGKKRIDEMINKGGTLSIKVLFAKGESSVTLEGYSFKKVSCNKGNINYNPDTHLFSLTLPSGGKNEVMVSIK